MLVSDFDFLLPDELIAQHAAPRGESRLLTLDRRTGLTRNLRIGDLPSLLRAGDLLVVNDTRVFAARLLGHRVPSGGAVECLLLGPPIERQADGAALFEALVHPGQKLKPGARVRFEGPAGTINAEIRERRFSSISRSSSPSLDTPTLKSPSVARMTRLLPPSTKFSRATL